MPHKVNPIFFENAEAHLGIARSYFAYLSEKLPISRMQRDLSDKTTLRHQGVPIAHTVIAVTNIMKGLARLTVHTDRMNAELDHHWEVLAEAIQTMLRKHGHENPYETIKELTRGVPLDEEKYKEIVASLEIPEGDKAKLLALTPTAYVGLSEKLVK